MQDYIEILRVMSDYCYYTDVADSRAWANCFTEDCVWEGGHFGRFEGREGAYAYHSAPGDIAYDYRHITTNHRVDIDGDRAVATSHIQVFDQQGETPVLIFSGLYDDVFERRDGKWLIHSRTLVFDPRHFTNKAKA